MSDFNHYSFPKLQASLGQVLSQLHQTTLDLLMQAKDSDWSAFLQSLSRRETLLQQLQVIKQQCQQCLQNYGNNYSRQQWEYLNRLACSQLEKVAKVEQEVFDTIKMKREALMDDIIRLNKGLAFLREYEKGVRPQHTLSELF